MEAHSFYVGRRSRSHTRYQSINYFSQATLVTQANYVNIPIFFLVERLIYLFTQRF